MSESAHNTCGCVMNNDWSDGDTSCKARGPEDTLCTRRDGHDGPHSACNMIEHPLVTWTDE